MLFKFDIMTPDEGMIDITNEVRQAIKESGVDEGICVVFCPHTTAAITINENADPDVKTDFMYGMSKSFPDSKEFRHFEGNSSAHLKSSSVGASETIIISRGMPLLGRWQGVYFCEFDGPRTRQFFVKLVRS